MVKVSLFKITCIAVLVYVNCNSTYAQHKEDTGVQTTKINYDKEVLTIDDKVKFILETSGQIWQIQNWLQKEYIDPAAISVNSQNKEAVAKIKEQITKEEITIRLIAVFKKRFNESDITAIYQFSKSSAGRNFLGHYNIVQLSFKESFEPLIQEIKQLNPQDPNLELKPKSVFSINRPDGLYKVLNYNLYKTNTIDKYILDDSPSITIADISEAKQSVLKDLLNRIVIDISLTGEGAIKFKTLTAENIGKPIVFVFDKIVLTAPIVQTEIPGGKLQISGDFTEKEAKAIADKINSQVIK